MGKDRLAAFSFMTQFANLTSLKTILLTQGVHVRVSWWPFAKKELHSAGRGSEGCEWFNIAINKIPARNSPRRWVSWDEFFNVCNHLSEYSGK
jgi:hypothetical protein